MPITESSVDPMAASEFNWFKINMSGDFNWDVIFINASVNVSKNFSKGVRRLLGN